MSAAERLGLGCLLADGWKKDETFAPECLTRFGIVDRYLARVN